MFCMIRLWHLSPQRCEDGGSAAGVGAQKNYEKLTKHGENRDDDSKNDIFRFSYIFHQTAGSFREILLLYGVPDSIFLLEKSSLIEARPEVSAGLEDPTRVHLSV